MCEPCKGHCRVALLWVQKNTWGLITSGTKYSGSVQSQSVMALIIKPHQLFWDVLKRSPSICLFTSDVNDEPWMHEPFMIYAFVQTEQGRYKCLRYRIIWKTEHRRERERQVSIWVYTAANALCISIRFMTVILQMCMYSEKYSIHFM